MQRSSKADIQRSREANREAEKQRRSKADIQRSLEAEKQ
jgi:hypothetical protein